MVKLIKEVLQGNISFQGLSYLCDCFSLGERIDYQDEEVSELVFDIADPEINGGFKSEIELQHILQKIDT